MFGAEFDKLGGEALIVPIFLLLTILNCLYGQLAGRKNKFGWFENHVLVSKGLLFLAFFIGGLNVVAILFELDEFKARIELMVGLAVNVLLNGLLTCKGKRILSLLRDGQT
mmetsp:Transcript_27273/g.24075  ORF Transcript_27273/g.24075 Transcript_27273/m.24075 type:complete len:111 (+) Transcript_27273:139-471(+)